MEGFFRGGIVCFGGSCLGLLFLFCVFELIIWFGVITGGGIDSISLLFIDISVFLISLLDIFFLF